MFSVRVDESHRARPHLRAPALHGQLDSSFPDKPHFSVEMAVRRVGSSARRQSGLVDFHGLARGEFAFEEVARITAEFDVRGVSFSKGYIAVGSTVPSWALASAGRIAGIRTVGANTAGRRAHNSRRVTDMIFSLGCV